MVSVSPRPWNNSDSISAFLLITLPTTSGERTTTGAAGTTSLSHLHSSGFKSSRSPRKTGCRKYFSCVHPLNFTRATTTGLTHVGFSLVSGTLSNEQVDTVSSFNLLLNSACFFASNPLPTCPINLSFFPSYNPSSNEPKGIASVRASVHPPTTASSVWLTFSFAQLALRSPTYRLSAR